MPSFLKLTIDENLKELKTLQDAYNAADDPHEFVAIYKTLQNRVEKLGRELQRIAEDAKFDNILFEAVMKKMKKEVNGKNKMRS